MQFRYKNTHDLSNLGKVYPLNAQQKLHNSPDCIVLGGLQTRKICDWSGLDGDSNSQASAQ